MKTEVTLFLLFAMALSSCSSTTTTKSETETHFLQSCEGACEDGLSCICGVCTEECASDGACEALAAGASCATTAPSCAGAVESTCDVECTRAADCNALEGAFECRQGRCRATAEGESGQGGAGGSGGAGEDGGAGQGGSGGQGSGGQSAGSSGGAGNDAAIDTGGVGGAPDGGIEDTDCDEVGELCCPGKSQDEPDYCVGPMVECGMAGRCQSNCACALPVYIPVCGVDGNTYSAACGTECITVEIACDGECPCGGSYCTVACSGARPTQEQIDACEAITDSSACVSSIPSACRWVTPSSEPCPLVP